jgi:hypothetical protein
MAAGWLEEKQKTQANILSTRAVGSGVGTEVGNVKLSGLALLDRRRRGGREEKGGDGCEALHVDGEGWKEFL